MVRYIETILIKIIVQCLSVNFLKEFSSLEQYQYVKGFQRFHTSMRLRCSACLSLQFLRFEYLVRAFLLYLKSRRFWVQRTHRTGLCILKPENVSHSCRDITVSKLLEMNFYFERLCILVLTFKGRKLGESRASSPLPMLWS